MRGNLGGTARSQGRPRTGPSRPRRERLVRNAHGHNGRGRRREQGGRHPRGAAAQELLPQSAPPLYALGRRHVLGGNRGAEHNAASQHSC